LEDVDRIMGFAKLDGSDFQNNVQCLNFVSGLDNTSIQLMEVTPSILTALEQGETVTFRGQEADSAVLCTETLTYDVRSKETSNNLLVLPSSVIPDKKQEDGQTDRHVTHRQVVGMIQEYFEVLPARPRTYKLKELLSDNIFSGVECEDDDMHQGKKYTLSELRDCIQASDAQLRAGLYAIEACCVSGFWRLIDFDLRGQILDHMLGLCDEQGWPITCIPCAAVCDTLQDLYPRSVVLHILQCFSDCGPAEEEAEHYSLSEDKICRYYAENLLKETEKMCLEDFESAWQISVPESFKTSLYQLQGLALVDRESRPAVVRYFPVNTLPDNTQDRFDTLFMERPKWTLDEITPYIKDITTDKLGVGALLMKYCRGSMQNGVKVYNSKKTLS